MRILITNDDGISAPGLKVLEQIAGELAGDDGEVWTVAPAFEQSGVGHCISYTHPMLIAKLGERCYVTEGSPADCVIAGLHEVMADAPPDLVISGVNRGNNSAENALYSGTLGAAMEAALQGITALALSQFLGPHTAGIADPFETARIHGAGTVRRVLAAAPDTEEDYRLFYNVNFPPLPASDVRGLRVAAQGFRRNTHFGVAPHTSPSGRRFLWIRGGNQLIRTLPQTDAAANLDGYISVTPMRADLTAHDMMGHFRTIET